MGEIVGTNKSSLAIDSVGRRVRPTLIEGLLVGKSLSFCALPPLIEEPLALSSAVFHK